MQTPFQTLYEEQKQYLLQQQAMMNQTNYFATNQNPMMQQAQLQQMLAQQFQQPFQGQQTMLPQQFQNPMAFQPPYGQPRTMLQGQPMISQEFLTQSVPAMGFQRSVPDLNTQQQRSQSPSIGQTFNFGAAGSSVQSQKHQLVQPMQYQQPFDLTGYDMPMGRPGTVQNSGQFWNPMMNQMQPAIQQRVRSAPGYQPEWFALTGFSQFGVQMQQESMMQTTKITIDQVLRKVVEEIRFTRETPSQFFKKFDAFQTRKFQTWEIMVMFQLTYPEARTITNNLDPQFGHTVEFKALCQLLSSHLGGQLNFSDFTDKSDYAVRLEQSPSLQKQFSRLARTLRESKELAPNSGTYHEAFINLQKKNQSGEKKYTMPHTLLRDALSQKCANYSNLDELINFMQLQTEEIHLVQFNQALRQIEPDYKVWDLKHLLEYYIKDTEDPSASNTAAQTTLTPIHKARQEIFKKNLMEKFKQLQAKTEKHECKSKSDQQPVTVIINCIKAETLFAFFDDDDLKYSQKQKHACLDPYRVELLLQAGKTLTSSQMNNTAKEANRSPDPEVAASRSFDQSQTATQFLQVPGRPESPAPSQQPGLSRDPSEESLNRRVDSQPSHPPTNANGQPFEEQKISERSDEWEYEEDQDQMEGGQKEPSQRNAVFYDYDRVLADLQPTREMKDPALIQAKILKNEIFESIKGWLILQSDTVLGLFKQIDRRGTYLATTRMLKSFLVRVLQPRECTEDMINSITTFFKQVNDKGVLVVDYCTLYKFFNAYANLKRLTVQDKAQFQNFLQFKGFPSAKSLGAFFDMDARKIVKNEPIAIDADKFYESVKHELKIKEIKNQDEINKEIQVKHIVRDPQNPATTSICLRKFKDAMGYDLEAEPTFVEKATFRPVVIQLLLNNQNHQIKSLRKQFKTIENPAMFFNQMKAALLDPHTQATNSAYNNVEFDNPLKMICLEFRKEQDKFNTPAFLNRLEAEINKVFQLMRFFIMLKAKANKRKCMVKDILEDYDKEFGTGEISKKRFIEILSDLDVCSEASYLELQYFLDEYDPEESGMIALKKIEEDYEEFTGQENCILEKVSDYFFRKIDYYGCDLYQELVNVCQDKEPSKRRNWPKETIHLYDFKVMFDRMLSQKLRNNNDHYDGDLLTLFMQFIANEGTFGANILSVAILLERYLRHLENTINPTQRQIMKRFIVRTQAFKLMKRIVQTIHYHDKGPLDYFLGRQASDDEFVAMINHVDFNIASLKLSSPLVDIIEYFKPANSSFIDVQEFVQTLTSQLKNVKNCYKQFKSIHRQLTSKGVRLADAIKMCQGQLNTVSSLNFDDLVTLCRGYEIKFEPVSQYDQDKWLTRITTGLGKNHLLQVASILENFEKDEQGEVLTSQFIEEFEASQKGTKQKPDFMKQTSDLLSQDGQALLPEITAQRYFTSSESLVESVALEIQRRKLTDLGSYLKGHDYANDDTITHSDFFNIFSTIFQHLAKGDVLDLIQHFDKERKGSVNLNTVATDFNRRMKSCFIVLKSQVDLVNERIVEPTTPKHVKNSKSKPKKTQALFLDLLCGLHIHKRGTLEEWLTMFGRQEEGFISFAEFRVALDKMDVQVDSQAKHQVFEYFRSQASHDFAHSLVRISEMLAEVQNEIPHQDLDSVATQVLKLAAPVLLENQIPLRDSCQKFETSAGSGQILFSDFTYQLLTDQLKLKSVLSQNMLEAIHSYYNKAQGQHVSYEPFLADLRQIQQELKIKFYMTQQEVDDDTFGQTGITTQSRVATVAPKTEPQYDVVTKMNTYTQITGVHNIAPLTDRDQISNCNDILIGTRAKGMSVEHYFQKYGVISKRDGIRYLTCKDFRIACMGLKLKWADDPDIVKRLYRQIEENYLMLDGLTLEMIGGTIFLNATVNMEKVEAEMLQTIHRHICDSGLIYTVPDLFNFINFERDGTIPLRDFARLLLDTFKLRGRIHQTTLEAYYQRYRVPCTPVDHQEVCVYDFLQDLAYQHVSVGVEMQFAAKITERILKQAQVQRLRDTQTSGISDHEVMSHMRQYFLQNSMQGGGVNFTFTDMVRILRGFGFEDQSGGRPSKQIEDYFKLCSVLGKSNDIYAADSAIMGKTSYIDLSVIQLPEVLKFDQLMEACSKLIRKPIQGLYQDVLDLVYMSSKRRKISISGPYIMTLFQGEDPQKNGLTSEEAFDRVITKKLCHKSLNVSADDVAFLASKYLRPCRSGQFLKQISYTDFLNDYYEHETGRLGDCMNLIFAQGDQTKQQDILKKMAKNSPRSLANSVGDLPVEQRQIFIKMGKYLRAKDLDELLCGELIMKDELKRGYLSKEQIKDSVSRIGIPISARQADQLTAVLKQDSESKGYNYLEMIAFLMDPAYMQRLQQENNIWPNRSYTEQDVIVDITKLKLSSNLVSQLELKLSSIRQTAHSFHRGTQLVKAEQVFEIFNQTQIILNPKDTDTLQRYLGQMKDGDGFVSLNDLLQHFNVDEEPSSVLQNIMRQLGDKQHVFGQAQTFELGDFKACLLKAGVTLPIDNRGLQKLFTLMCGHQNEVSRITLESVFKIDSQKSAKKTVEIPASGKRLVNFLVRNKLDLLAQFEDCKKTKRIPQRRFAQFLQEQNFNFQTPTDKQSCQEYFEASDGQVDFVKLFKACQQADANFGKRHVTKSHRAQLAVQTYIFMPHAIKVALSRLAQAAKNKELLIEQLFKDLDKNKDGRITFSELDHYCLTNEISVGLPQESISALFKYLDYDNDGSVSLSELQSMLEAAQANQEDRMKKAFSCEFEQKLVNEVSELFDRLDTDKSKFLTADELCLASKQQDQMFMLDLEEAKAIVNRIGSNDHINKQQFVNYVIPKQKEQLLQIHDNMEDLRRLFEHYSSCSQGEFQSKKALNREGLKKLLVSTGCADITDEKVEILFADIDTNQSGLVDMDEFMAFMYVGDKIDVKSRTLILEIRKAHMRLNARSLIDMLRLAPRFTTCSITQKYLERDQTFRPSYGLLPQFDQQTLKYKEMDRVGDYSTMGQKEFITKNKPVWAFECQISEVSNVPSLAQLIGEDGTSHQEIRVFLMQQKRKVVRSGIQICRANATPTKNKDDEACNWAPVKSQNTFLLRSQDNLDLVIELCAYDPKDKSKQLTICWTRVPLSTLKSGKNHLQLQGGSPFNQHALAFGSEEKSGGLMNKIFGGQQKREVVLNVKSFLKLDDKHKAKLSVLPEDIIVWRNVLPFALAFRVYSHDKLARSASQNPTVDLVISQFSRIYDSPDIMEVISECLPHLLTDTTPTEQLVKLMERSVNRIYGLFTVSELKFDSVYPTRSTHGQLIHTLRNQEIKRAFMMEKPLLADRLGVSLQERVKEEILFMEEYTPFTIDEMQGGLDHAKVSKQEELEQIFALLGLSQ